MSEMPVSRSKTWMERMGLTVEEIERSAPALGEPSPSIAPGGPAVPGGAGATPPTPTAAAATSSGEIRAAYNGYLLEQEDALDEGIGRLREEALRIARIDADAGVPQVEVEGRSESESELEQRCQAFFERWQSHERRRVDDVIATNEEEISEKLGLTSIAIDRFERLTNDIIRLKARVSTRRLEVARELSQSDESSKEQGIPTKIYVAAIGFLGLVEFFANAPVFGALLPRDPLTERQIRLVSETSEGWFAGAQRVFAQLILRPDAALLAAGVVTFLCVLAHFFGHSLRDFVVKRDREAKRHAVTTRSVTENVVPMILGGTGLVLVLSVLFVARVKLGEVGEEQYQQDITVVEELRRNAGWLRVDGDLLAANEQANRADDMEAAATELREYAASMSRLSWPILLLNTTLVLCAISAAYFHRRDDRREFFNESPVRGGAVGPDPGRRGVGYRGHDACSPSSCAGYEFSRACWRRNPSITGEAYLISWRRSSCSIGRRTDARGAWTPGRFRLSLEPVDLKLDVDADYERDLMDRDPLEYERERQGR